MLHERIAFGDPRLPERFWAKVQVQPDGCWQWTACLVGGYGWFGHSGCGYSPLAHRRAYTVLVADPGELHIDHLCRNRACVNPAHLEPVTNKENILRGVGAPAVNARKTHCKHGHEFTPDNVFYARGQPTSRRCRECGRISTRRFRAKQKRARAALASLSDPTPKEQGGDEPRSS